MEIISYLFALSATFIAAISQLLLKSSANKTTQKEFIYKFLNVRVITAYLMLFSSLCLNQLAFRVVPLNIVPAISATGFIWILLISTFILKEKVNKYNVIGTIIIFLGVLVCILQIFVGLNII